MSRATEERTDPSQPGAPPTGLSSSRGEWTRGLRHGTVGGLIATAGMTLYRVPIFRALPPTAEFWARYVGPEDAERNLGPGIALHFLYGAVAGAVFGAAFGAVFGAADADRPTAVTSRLPVRRETAGVVAGLAYGVVLSVFGARILLQRLLEQDLDPDERLVFHVGHVIYGLTLGTWISAGEGFGDVYE